MLLQPLLSLGNNLPNLCFSKSGTRESLYQHSPRDWCEMQNPGLTAGPARWDSLMLGAGSLPLGTSTSTPAPEEVLIYAYIWECVHPVSRIFCLLGWTRVLYSAGVSPLMECPLLPPQRGGMGSEGDPVCPSEEAWTWQVSLSGRSDAQGTWEGRSKGDCSQSCWWRGWAAAVRWAKDRPPSQEYQHLSYFVVKPRNLCSVGCRDGREGPTEHHVQLSPRSSWSHRIAFPISQMGKLRTRDSIDAPVTTFSLPLSSFSQSHERKPKGAGFGC